MVDQPREGVMIAALNSGRRHQESHFAAAGMAMILMGIGSVVARAAEVDGPVLALHRVWVAALLHLLVLLATGHKLTFRQLRLAAPGGLAFGAQIALLYSALQLTTVANATMIMALHPVLVLGFFSARFKEPVRSADWSLSAAALAGISLVMFGSSDSPAWSPIGDLLAFGSLIAWSLYFSFSKRARVDLGAFEYQGLLLISSAVLLLPVTLTLGKELDPGTGKWPWVLAMVAIPGTGHLLINWAHPRVSLALMSQLTLVSPIVSVVLAAAVIGGEAINTSQLVGMTIVVGALALLVRNRPANHPSDHPSLYEVQHDHHRSNRDPDRTSGPPEPGTGKGHH